MHLIVANKLLRRSKSHGRQCRHTTSKPLAICVRQLLADKFVVIKLTQLRVLVLGSSTAGNK